MQVMPMKSTFLRMVPAQKTVVGRSWAGCLPGPLRGPVKAWRIAIPTRWSVGHLRRDPQSNRRLANRTVDTARPRVRIGTQDPGNTLGKGRTERRLELREGLAAPTRAYSMPACRCGVLGAGRNVMAL